MRTKGAFAHFSGLCSTSYDGVLEAVLGSSNIHPCGLFVDLAAMGNPRNDNEFCPVIDNINNAPVANADALLVFITPQFLAARRTGIVSQCQNLAIDSLEYGSVQGV
jgi:hypothetical protein